MLLIMNKANDMEDSLIQHKLGVAFFHKDCNMVMGGTIVKYPAKCAAVLPYQSIPKANIEEMLDKKVFSLYSLDSFFDRYQYGEKATMLFTHIGGGIGDMIAFSAIPAFLSRYKIKVHTDTRFVPVFQWFTHPILLAGWSDPIVKDFTAENRLVRYKYLRRLALEYSAIEGREKNWYEGFFQRIGISDVPDEYKRPHLNKTRPSITPTRLRRGSVIICHRASCQMRSSTLEDFYIPVRAAYPRRPIYVNETDLTESDREYAGKNKIHILPKSSIEQFLLDLFDADMVITTDSAAIHFREGIEKPCLCALAATTVESRTLYHLHTRSFNVRSDCPYEPCFIHELKKNMVCKNASEGDRVARCQTGESFREQLYENLKNY